MPAEDPTGPPAKFRSWTTVPRRWSRPSHGSSRLQLSVRIDAPSREREFTRGFEALEAPQPASSAPQQMRQRQRGASAGAPAYGLTES